MDLQVKTRQYKIHNTILYNPLHHIIFSPNSPLHYQAFTSIQSTSHNQQKSHHHNHHQHLSPQGNNVSQSIIRIIDEQSTTS
jgi:hypothetical protein